MTREDLSRFVATCLPALGLTHWNVKVDWEEAPVDGAEAEVRADGSYDHATVLFSSACLEWDEGHAALVIVHELVHLITRDLERAVDDTIEALPNASARALARSRFTHELEGVVDRVAAALVRPTEAPCS